VSRYGCTFLMFALPVLITGQNALAEQITVETTECSGDSGFSSFDESRIFKIQSGDCDNPDRPGEKLYQILLNSNSRLTRYEVLWVTRDEAKSVMAQTRENRDYRRKRDSGHDNITINVSPPPAVQSPAPMPPKATPAAPAESTKDSGKQTARNMYIEILDPPLMRSASQVLSDANATERIIVGRVTSPGNLVSLSLNGKPLEISDKGIFKRTVPLNEQRTHIEITAVDESGNHEERDFWLVMPPKETAGESKGSSPDMDSSFGRYHALVIGINNYPHYRHLNTAVADAQAVEKILKQRYGFTTRLLINPSRHEIIRTISELRKELTENDNLLIYYAGHGEYDRVNLRGYWLPADAEPDSPANWISTIDITDAINRMSAKHIMIVADSCYSGAISRAVSSDLDPGMSKDAKNRWIQVMAKSRVRMVLTSGGLEPVSDGGGGSHSVFANAFITALKNNNAVLDGGHLFEEVRDTVTRRAKELGVDQVPEYAALKSSNHEFGDFLFVANK